MNLEKLRPHLLHEFKSEHDLVRAVDELSLKFTREREHVSDYLKDPRLVSAYTAFYLTTNIPKLEAVMKWLPQRWSTELLNCDLIDLGAGPGTFSLAFQAWAPEFKGDIYQIEKAPMMREQARKIWAGLHPEKVLHQDDRVGSLGKRPRFLLFGHSANEMGPELVLNYIEKIEPDHILFIEPGTKSFFSEMLKIRSALLSRGMSILYPCPGTLECPMKGSQDWCHQFVDVSHSADVERLSQLAKKDRRHLPLTVHAYSKSVDEKNPSERLVRVLPETKFSFEWEVCHDHRLEHYQIMKRAYSTSELKSLSKTVAGVSLETLPEKSLEKVRRVKLISVHQR